MTIRKKRKFKSIISTFLCLALLGGAVFGITKLLKADSPIVKINNSAFAVGALDEDGKYVENKQTLYTKEMFRCDDLAVELDKDCASTYEIFFYNYFGEFINSTGVLSEDFEEEIDIGSVYAKIVVIPEIPEGENVADFKISFFEKAKFLDGITITVDNDQDDGNVVKDLEMGTKYEVVEYEHEPSEDENSISSFVNLTLGYVYKFVNEGENDITVGYHSGADKAYITTIAAGESYSFAADCFDHFTLTWDINDPTPIVYIDVAEQT